MKKLNLIFTLFFSIIIFSSPSYSEWILVSTQSNGDKYFYEDSNIRKSDGFVYFWRMVSFDKKIDDTHSGVTYVKSDCSIFRLKYVFAILYSGPFKTGEIILREELNKGWDYPQPGSVNDKIMKKICNL